MANHDVFISYSREDRPKVEKIAHALNQRGLRVWWDPEIKTGAGFRQEIGDALNSTRSVIVMWSRYSVASRFVADEADEGAAREILFPALIDNVDIPLGFRQIQTADLTHWRGNLNDNAFKAFISAVGDGAANARGAPDRRPQPAPASPEPAAEAPPKKQKKPKPPKRAKQPKAPKSAYTTTGSKRRLALFAQAIFMAALIAAAFGALAYTSDFVFAAYRPFFVGAMGILAFLSRYGTLEADRAAGAASLALLPRSYMALILFSLIASAPLILEGRIYAAALEGVQVKGIEGADINGVTLDDAGTRLLTSSDDSTVKLWDATTGVELAEYTLHENWVWDADFSPDGKFAVSASRDLSADIWSTSNAKRIRQLKGHASSIRDAAWSPDGSAIATSSNDKTIIIWDPDTGEAVRTLSGHTDRVAAIDFSPDGEKLVSASRDGTVRLWNWRNGGRISTLSIGGEGNAVAFSNDGSMFAAAADNGKIRIWRTKSRDRLATFNHGAAKAFGVAFANNDKTLATSGIDPVIRLWNIADQTLIAELEGHRDASRALDSSSDGAIIVSGSRDNTARIWDAVTGEELVTMGHISSAIDLPMAIDTPPVFVSSQAPVPVDFNKHPQEAAYLLGKGVLIAAVLLLAALIIKGVLWVVKARAIARTVVVTALFAVSAYVGLLIASALPAEALALWLTLAFVPATIFALLRWIWRATILRNFSRRTRKAG